MISVIIPTFNEIKHGCLSSILASFAPHKEIEVICVDSGSTDGTRELIENTSNVKLIEHVTTSRGERLTIGAKAAKHKMILLHHPRSVLSQVAILDLSNQVETLAWGAFTHAFDQKQPILQFTSWYSNHVRGDLKGIFYLDHCIFVRKDLLDKVDYLKFVDVFEDTYLSQDLYKLARPTRLPGIATTSAVRFMKNGIIKQSLRNYWAKLQFLLGRDHKTINSTYESGLPLNCNYKKPENK